MIDYIIVFYSLLLHLFKRRNMYHIWFIYNVICNIDMVQRTSVIFKLDGRFPRENSAQDCSGSNSREKISLLQER